jgi:hypothetical protein
VSDLRDVLVAKLRLLTLNLEPDAFARIMSGHWRSRQELIDHIEAAWSEYNQLYAHPFQWTWTNQKMRRWFAKHASDQA